MFNRKKELERKKYVQEIRGMEREIENLEKQKKSLEEIERLLQSQEGVVALEKGYLTQAQGMVFGPSLLTLLLSPKGMAAFEVEVITGGLVEIAFQKMEPEKIHEWIKGVIENVDYAYDHKEEVITNVLFPKNR